MLFIGDDWAEGHHDIEVEDDTGRRLARIRLPEGVEGLARLHEVVAEHLDPDSTGSSDLPEGAVVVGIETDRGVWVSALLACGYQVYAINPMSAARYRERHGTSGAKSDAGDAHVLAEIVRLDRGHHRQIAGDSPQVEALKLLARAHQGLIWDRTRHLQRMRSALREYFPAALTAFDNLAAPDTLALLRKAPDPDRAARLTTGQITAELARAHRRGGPYRQGHPHPRCAAGASAAATGCNRTCLRGRRGRTSAHARAPGRADRGARAGGQAQFSWAPGR